VHVTFGLLTQRPSSLHFLKHSEFSQDAFFVKLRTKTPASQAIVQTLADLRVLCLRQYGGRGVDFDVHCLADRSGWFVITFNAVAPIQKVPDSYSVRALPRRLSALSVPHSTFFCAALLYGRAGRLTAQNGGFRPGQFKNPATDNLSDEYDIPCQTVDSSQVRPWPKIQK
jgi:hypothetical protein